MRKGKYQKSAVASSSRKRQNILVISLVVLLVAMIGGTIAYLMDTTNQLTNTFTPAEVEIDPTEETTENSKSEIMFKNNGDVPVYIRASLAIYWTDAADNVVPKPDDSDVILGTLKANWELAGDIYYYKQIVAPGDSTAELMGAITVKNVPKGYKCHIDVLSEAIQAVGIGENVDYKTVWTAAKGTS